MSRRFIHRSAALFAGAAISGAAMAGTGSWNPVAEFSGDNGNPNGVWSYGWMPVGFGDLTLYTNHRTGTSPGWWGWGGDQTPGIWRNDSASTVNGVGPGQLSLHPGNGTQPSVLRWTAPAQAAGDVRLTGRFFAGDGGSMQVAVRINGGEAWHAVDHGAFDLVFASVEGSTVDFAVYGGYGYGSTPLEVQILAGEFCNADYNQDGSPDLTDVFDLAVDVAAGGQSFPPNSPDFNNDGSIDLTDVFDLANRISGGSCP